MPNYIFKAFDPQTQQKISGEIVASDQLQASKVVLDRGLQPLTIKEDSKSFFNQFQGKIKRKDRLIFTNYR